MGLCKILLLLETYSYICPFGHIDILYIFVGQIQEYVPTLRCNIDFLAHPHVLI